MNVKPIPAIIRYCLAHAGTELELLKEVSSLVKHVSLRRECPYDFFVMQMKGDYLGTRINTIEIF